MGSMTPQEIGRTASRIFESCLPSSWAALDRQNQEDGGIDYEIEVKENDKPTGMNLKVQVKGKERAAFVANGALIPYYGLPVEKLEYYLRKIQSPIFFVIVDLSSKKVFWERLQGNPGPEMALSDAINSRKATVTVHVPKINEFPQTIDKLLKSVSDVRKHLSMREVLATPLWDFPRVSASSGSLKEIATDLQNKVGVLRLEELEILFKNASFEDLKKKASTIRANLEYLGEIRFAAALYEEKASLANLSRGSVEFLANEMQELFAETTRQLHEIAKSGPMRLKYFASLYRRAGNLHEAVQEVIQLHMLRDVPAWNEAFVLVLKLTDKLKIMVRQYNHCCRILSQLMRTKDQVVIPQLVARLIGPMHQLIVAIHLQAPSLSLKSYLNSLESIAAISLEIAVAHKQWDDVILVSLSSLFMVSSDSLVTQYGTERWCRSQILRVTDIDKRNEGLLQLNNQRKQRDNQKSADSFSPEGLIVRRQIFRNLARAIGIDPENDVSIEGQLIRIGLRDLDPTSVLRHCESLMAVHSGTNRIVQLMQFPSAGSKTIICTRFRYTREQMSLDQAFTEFRESFCDACKFCVPRGSSWRFSESIAKQEAAIHANLLLEMDQIRFGNSRRPDG